MKRTDAVRLRQIIERAVESLDDSTALEAVTLYPAWSGEGVGYPAGARVRHEGVLYRVLATHTSQPTWTPDVSPSLFARVLIPDDGSIPEWVQPDSTNAYSQGDRVTHNGQTWQSDVDANVWEPGVYGWSAVS